MKAWKNFNLKNKFKNFHKNEKKQLKKVNAIKKRCFFFV
jgi:hypothetical protein